jgi:nickel-dependent lactate racemase
VYVRAIERPADVLRLRVPLPLGRNLYQADKALKNNHHAVRDGGGIVLEADCPEGIGPDAFMNLLRRAGDYATARQIVAQEGYRLGDHKAVKLRHLTDPAQRGVHVALVSPNVTVADVEIAGMSAFAEVTSAIDWLARVLTGPLERGLTVEDAGVVCVRPRSR